MLDKQINKFFVSPYGNNKTEMTHFFNEVCDLLLNKLSDASNRSTHPVSVNKLNFSKLLKSGDSKELMNKLSLIIESSTNLSTPKFIGHMDSIPSAASILGDLVASALNNNMLFQETSQSLTKLERELLREFAVKFGFNKNKSGGILLSGGTLSNLHALIIARNKVLNSKNLGARQKNVKPVIYVSEAAHSSIDKAAMIMGLGTDAVVKIPVDENSQITIDLLQRKIKNSIDDGYTPLCIVGTAGTTVTGSIDDLEQLSLVAKEYGIWFHVDAAHGGTLILSRKHRDKLSGIQNADSITFNPHKWMYVPRSCSMVLYSDFKNVLKYFRVSAPYSASGEEIYNIGELSVHGSNHADILKLWLSIQHIGWENYEYLIDRSCDTAINFMCAIEEREKLRLVQNPQMNLVCFYVDSENDRVKNEELTLKLQKYLINEHGIFLSAPIYKGRRILRAVVLNPFTDKTILDSLFENIDKFLITNFG